MLVQRHLQYRTRVMGRSLSEAPISWGVLLGGTAYGLYLLFQGGFDVVKGAMVIALSMVIGVKGVFGA